MIKKTKDTAQALAEAAADIKEFKDALKTMAKHLQSASHTADPEVFSRHSRATAPASQETDERMARCKVNYQVVCTLEQRLGRLAKELERRHSEGGEHASQQPSS